MATACCRWTDDHFGRCFINEKWKIINVTLKRRFQMKY